MSTPSNSGLIFQLHPLVILNVSDHFTRYKAQKGIPQRVIGCLLGVQSGRVVEITNSFELSYTQPNNGSVVVDAAFLNKQQELYKATFPKCEVIGWYSTGSVLEEVDMSIHKMISEINESPVYMLMDPNIIPGGKDLPITLYESELHVIEGSSSTIFVTSEYTIETVEAERISVDQIQRIMPSGSTPHSSSQLTSSLQNMHSAIKMLNTRIKCIASYLAEVQQGKQPVDHALCRQISSLIRQLPAMDAEKFNQEFLTEYNDAVLMAYLATMTKGTAAINELAEKFDVAYDKNNRRRRFPI
mmetsp:Transcript_7095/g.8185  ORF Transcript_7095/g.8185 Transcript_7095/m.8185 type:complete len:300 (-) Transcript_7095:693-1592(-)|eukprot:CAMPEP_0197863986 /NCGR_PEP_ID=MMETSP1438-20131217/41826_1 /TAXON_ID=1461541 /ORGANISM="Pterosperma sp., Strain CCMP1384" /LENGTH=299 /DNA_ID=CAMNT_0043482057 /DNA_START=178 /DNA_END=1077 /DNA_ORIENTATION=-